MTQEFLQDASSLPLAPENQNTGQRQTFRRWPAGEASMKFPGPLPRFLLHNGRRGWGLVIAAARFTGTQAVVFRHGNGGASGKPVPQAPAIRACSSFGSWDVSAHGADGQDVRMDRALFQHIVIRSYGLSPFLSCPRPPILDISEIY